jgi:membrane associated rhomboid family serine protease
VVLGNYAFGNPATLTIGASGAIYGILLVAAILWPDRIIIFYIFPIKLKYFVMIVGAISLYNLGDINSGVSDVAHLSGMLFGYLFLKFPAVRRLDPLSSMQGAYRQWKLERAKKKFQVYMRKHKSDDGPWLH